MIRRIIRKTGDYALSCERNKFICLISTISIFKCLLLFLIIEVILTPNRQIGFFPDSTMYVRIADNILSGNGFSLSTAYPFKPTMFKEPLYSFFIVLFKFFPNIGVNFVVLAQILLNPLIALLIYFIGKETFNERIARLSGLLVAFMPVYGEISFFIMPEFIFTVLFCGTIFCLIKADKYSGWGWFILSGVLLGFSALSRNVVLPLFIIYPIFILVKKRKVSSGALFLKSALFILSFLIVTTPWMYRNQKELGLFSISRRGGEILSHQAYYAANFSADEWKAYSIYLVSGKLAKKLYPKIVGNDLGSYEYAYLMRTSYVDGLLKEKREGEAERILTRQAVDNIARHPFKYLLLSAITYIQSFKYFESIALMLLDGRIMFSMSVFRFFLFLAGIAYALIALYGMFRSIRLFKPQLILITIIFFHAILAIIGIVPGGLQRHIVPVTVLYSFFVIIAVDKGSRCAYS